MTARPIPNPACTWCAHLPHPDVECMPGCPCAKREFTDSELEAKRAEAPSTEGTGSEESGWWDE